MTVTNGGHLIAARLNVGEGGNYNHLSADGSDAYGASLIQLERFCIGGNAGTGQFGGNGNYNHVLIENGGRFIAAGVSNIPNGIGMTGTSSHNFMQVDGVGSTLYIQNDTAQLEVRSDSISTYAQGIYLDKSDSLLEINNGRLIAGQNVLIPGAMVSGLGRIHLLGQAYVSTSYTGSSIDSVIYGSGGLTKEGSGTLTLSKLNTYTGNTLINGKMVVAATGGLKFVVTDFSNNTIDQSGNGGTLIVNGSFTIDTSTVLASTGTWNLVNRDEFSGLSTTFSPTTFSVTRFTKNPDGNSKTGTSASIAIQSPFTAWVGPQAPPAGQDHFADDPNHDGVSNGLAWILGGGAMSESRALLPEASTRSGALTLSNFKCLKAGKRLGSTLTLRFGNDLDIWQTAAIPPGNATVNSVAFTITPLDANYDQVSATIPQSAAAEGRLFGRLEASGN